MRELILDEICNFVNNTENEDYIKLTDKDTYKELQKDTEDFLKWQRYILSDEAEKEAVEGNESIFTVMAANTVHFIGFNDLDD